jgi:hypothetical protein
VEDYICSSGQQIASLGTLDPIIMVNGKFDLCLKKQLKGYACLDTPPEQVKPIQMPLVALAISNAYTSQDPLWRATSKCYWPILPPVSRQACSFCQGQ